MSWLVVGFIVGIVTALLCAVAAIDLCVAQFEHEDDLLGEWVLLDEQQKQSPLEKIINRREESQK